MGGAVAEHHLDRAAVDEVQLLLLVVVVRAAFDAGRHHDRVHAERGHVEALADLAKAGTVAQRVEIADGIALAVLTSGYSEASICLFSSVGRQWSATLAALG